MCHYWPRRVYFGSQTRLSGIIDGTSNTLMIGERAFSKVLPVSNKDVWLFWYSGAYSDTMFTTLFPLNPYKKLTVTNNDEGVLAASGGGNAYTGAASSIHPGGANFAMCDGSVKFLKETIGTWQYNKDTLLPNGVTVSGTGIYTVAPGVQWGIYQALSTRNGNEVISADAY